MTTPNKLRREVAELKAKLAATVYALEYVRQWWDETGRDQGWHQSIGHHVEKALKRAKQP